MHETYSFGYWLRRRRKALDLTQAELAQRVSCAEITVRRLEADERRPSRQLADLLADALAVAPEERAAFLHAARAELAADHLPVADQPLRGPTQQPLPRHNLPAAVSSFVGRAQALTELRQLLTTTRLLTLTGAGGSGKTRLALEVAAQVVATYRDGVWLVELAALADPAVVPQAVATALGVTAPSQRPLTEVLCDYLQDKHLLLLLDNCEHLLAGAAQLAKTLLQSCPQLQILATSRELLHVMGEVNWLVPPLAVPPPQPGLPVVALAQYEAVQLFAERARCRQPTFALTMQNAQAVAEICQRLAGLPLALELAAARLGVLSVAQIAERLQDALGMLSGRDATADVRQQTLRATLDWSYQLLSAPERRLVARLSIFAGGWTLEAAEGVGAVDGVEAADVLDLLTQLVDKSLVMVEAGVDGAVRYRLLEPVRQYAAAQLARSGEAETVQQRHACFFLALAEQAAPKLRTAEQLGWLDLLEQEHDNLRAALGWALEQEQAALALRLVGALGWFWFLRGYLGEVERATQATLSRYGGDEHAELRGLRAKVLLNLGMQTVYEDHMPRAGALGAESLQLFRQVGDRWGSAAALVLLGISELWQGRFAAADRLAQLKAGVALTQDVGDPWLTAWALQWQGTWHRHQGEHAHAVVLLEESVALARQTGDRWLIARTLWGLGTDLYLAGALEQALAPLAESLALFQALGDKLGVAFGLLGLERVAFAQDDYARARVFAEQRLGICQAIGNQTGITHTRCSLGMIAHVQGDYARARQLYEQSLALARTIGEPGHIVAALILLGSVARDQGDLAQATACFEEVLTDEREVGYYKGDVAMALRELGLVARLQGDLERAAACFAESMTMLPGIGAEEDLALARMYLGRVVQEQGDDEQAQALYRESLASFQHRGPRVAFFQHRGRRSAIVECLERLAHVAAVRPSRAEPQRAARLWGTAAALREALGAPLPPVERREYEQAVAQARAHLDAATYAAAWAEGQAMTLEQAVAYALAAEEAAPSAVPEAPTTGSFMVALTPREHEVAALVARGLTNRQIAAQLGIARRTVDAHVSTILHKLGLSSRDQIAEHILHR